MGILGSKLPAGETHQAMISRPDTIQYDVQAEVARVADASGRTICFAPCVELAEFIARLLNEAHESQLAAGEALVLGG